VSATHVALTRAKPARRWGDDRSDGFRVRGLVLHPSGWASQRFTEMCTWSKWLAVAPPRLPIARQRGFCTVQIFFRKIT